MGRKPGSRLTQRKAKREIAKATRTTKYANQKGGGSNTKRFKGRKRSDAILDQPLHTRKPKEDAEEEAIQPEQIDDDKAIRAFQKKLRQIEELKVRREKGDELNDDQLDKIGQEAAILKKIIQLTAPTRHEGQDDAKPYVAVRQHIARPVKRRKP